MDTGIWRNIGYRGVCSLFLLATALPGHAGQALQSPYKMQITFSGYDRTGVLTNFPALVVFSTNLTGFSYAQFKSATGYDLRFADSTGTNELTYEIESWDTNGSSTVWVRVPGLSNSADSIWAYWGDMGKTGALAGASGSGTWQTNYVAVWHLGREDATASINDSTSSANSGTANGSTNAAGKAGYAQRFGWNDYVSAGAAGLDPHQGTVSAWAKPGAITYGNDPNPTGNPIGGGAGYSPILTNGDHVVSTKSELTNALGQAVAGEVVFVDGSAQIDMTGEEYVEIPAGVTLASDRGHQSSAGALLYNDETNTAVFLIAGPDVRVTGLRVRGPHPTTDRSGHSDGIHTGYENLEVDNCEVYQWAHAGVRLSLGARNAYIHHNYIHHCQREGLGYGVSHSKANSVIEANVFDYCRHHIAGSGYPGGGYEACYNAVLTNCNSSNFDMHGGGDRQDGTVTAASWINIHHNTFVPTNSVHGQEGAVGIRGIPVQGCWVHHNKFAHGETRKAVVQREPKGNMFTYQNLCGSNEILYVDDWYADRQTIFCHAAGNTNRISLFTTSNLLCASVGSVTNVNTGQNLEGTDWSHVALTWDHGSYKVYRDGAEVSAGSYPDFSLVDPAVYLGAYYGPSGYWQGLEGFWNGRIDEARVSNTARDGDWIWASWMNAASNTTFASYGSVQREDYPVVSNSGGASNVTVGSVDLYGYLSSTGSGPTDVYVYWGGTDCGTNKGAWDHPDYLGQPSEGRFSNTVAIASNRLCFYRCYATNGGGESWASTSERFGFVSSASLPFEETFESSVAGMAGTLGPVHVQHGWSVDPVDSAVVQDSDANHGTQACRVVESGLLSHTFSGTSGRLWWQFYANYAGIGVEDYSGDIPTDATAVFWVNSASNLVAFDSTTNVVLPSVVVQTNQWTHFLVHCDYSTKEWSLWLDGTQVVDRFSFYSDSLSGFNEVRVTDWSSDAELLLDDIWLGLRDPTVPRGTLFKIW